MRRIAVLTSGGDAPGMNAAIRSVVRVGIENGLDVYGVRHGYAGLVTGDLFNMGRRDVGGIMHIGGTILGSARSEEFKTEAGQRKALRSLNQHGVEGLIVIGGNGSQTGANAMWKLGLPVVGVASTIDNDLYGADITIGTDTALNIALEAIDRLKVTAASHERAFLIEVMGRDCGYLALMAGIAGGAEAILIPEVEVTPEQLSEELTSTYERGKSHAIIVVAEGAKHNANAILKYFREHEEHTGFELRATQLGHVQRGGTPSVFDRVLATRTAAAAVEHMLQGQHGVLVGMQGAKITATPLADVAGRHKPVDPKLYDLATVLAK